MIFSFRGNSQQQAEMENVQRVFIKKCRNHKECVGCELKVKDFITIGNSQVRCNTGRGDLDGK